AATFVAMLKVWTPEAAAAADLPMPMLGKYVIALLCVVGVGHVLASAGSVDRAIERQVASGTGAFDPVRVISGEFHAFLLFSLCGAMLLCHATDLVWLFLAFELCSLPTYVLVAIGRGADRSMEAAIKYFFLGAMSTATMLFGFALLYGATGTLELAPMREAFMLQAQTGGIGAMAVVGTLLAVIGICFKLAAVPMHFYAPDVYEGTSPGNAALLSTLPKVAGIVVLARIISTVGSSASPELLWRVVAVLAAVTMTVGNVMALWQTNLRRLLACSSIAHSGYLLVGIAAAAAVPAAAPGLLSAGGLPATLFYLATYAVATIGIFGALTYLGPRWPEWTAGGGARPPRHEIADVDDLDGLSGTNPVAAFAMAVFLLSLAGIPPLPGFWGKLSLAVSALDVDAGAAIVSGSRRAWFVGLAVVLVLNAAIAAAYYLRIIAAMYFKTTKRGVQADGGLAAGVAMLACLALVGVLTLQPRALVAAASRAGEALIPLTPPATTLLAPDATLATGR
ncbi:MAG: NADH-quinone oxidoreductase subunit N, partial [Planctomycetota bacterium]